MYGTYINGVLSDDHDEDGDNFTIESVTDGQHGTTAILPLRGNGYIKYTPELNFWGNDEFKYTIHDGKGGRDTATVKVYVGPYGEVDLVVVGATRFLINDGFTEMQHDPSDPNLYVSDRHPNPATGLHQIDPTSNYLKHATLKVGPAGTKGALTWSIPSHLLVWWKKGGSWVRVQNDSNFIADGTTYDLLIEGINLGENDLVINYTPDRGVLKFDFSRLTVYTTLKVIGDQADAFVTALSNASNLSFTKLEPSGAIIVDDYLLPTESWKLRFFEQFGTIWQNTDTSNPARNGVVTIKTGEGNFNFGSYLFETVNMDHMNQAIAQDAQVGAALLLHEMIEQYYKQIKNMQYISDPTDEHSGGAHTQGILAEEAVVGGPRSLPTRNNVDGSFEWKYQVGLIQVKLKFFSAFIGDVRDLTITR